MGFGELRGENKCWRPIVHILGMVGSQTIALFPFSDALLAFDPLDIDHVKTCNRAEAEFWNRNEGYQTRPSDELLQFDCGGQVSRQRSPPRRDAACQSSRIIHDVSRVVRSNGFLRFAFQLERRIRTMGTTQTSWRICSRV